MSETFQAVANSQLFDRRLHPRQRVLFSCMRLDNENGGVILNLSESGLAMQLVQGLGDESLPTMRFQLSQSNTWIEAKGRIVWTDASRKMAGIEFVDLPHEGRILVNNWITSVTTPAIEPSTDRLLEDLPPVQPASGALVPASAASASAAGMSAEHDAIPQQLSAAKAPTVFVPNFGDTRKRERLRRAPSLTLLTSSSAPRKIRAPFYLSSDLSTRVLEAKINPRRTRQLIGIALLAVFLPSALIFLAFRLRGTSNLGLRTSEVTVAAKETEPPPNTPAVPKGVPVNPSSAPVAVNLPLDRPGYVLQVGAMRLGENASALAESLRERNFPAFVWRLGTDRLYRVVVGPYNDAESTQSVKEELKNQGFDSIRMAWNPKGEQKPTQH